MCEKKVNVLMSYKEVGVIMESLESIEDMLKNSIDSSEFWVVSEEDKKELKREEDVLEYSKELYRKYFNIYVNWNK